MWGRTPQRPTLPGQAAPSTHSPARWRRDEAWLASGARVQGRNDVSAAWPRGNRRSSLRSRAHVAPPVACSPMYGSARSDNRHRSGDAVGVGVLAVTVMVSEAFPRLLVVSDLWTQWRLVLLRSLAAGSVWLVLVPLLWIWAPRIAQTRALAVRLAIGFATILAATFADALWSRWGYHAMTRGLVDWWFARGERSMYTAVGVMATRVALDQFRAAAASQVRAVQQRLALRKAEMQRLDLQLQPHFLFNALNTVAELVHQSSSRAELMINDLLQLFEAMGAREVHERSLRDELGSLAPYLRIQQARFGERLTLQLDVPPDVARYQVPALILQPLIENAIRHGIERLTAGGTIGVSARRVHDTVEIAVRNPLPVTSVSTFRLQSGGGLGTRNVKERLRLLHGDHGVLSLTMTSAGEAVAVARFPAKEGTDSLSPAPTDAQFNSAVPDPGGMERRLVRIDSVRMALKTAWHLGPRCWRCGSAGRGSTHGGFARVSRKSSRASGRYSQSCCSTLGSAACAL